jgi:hypothetical protein
MEAGRKQSQEGNISVGGKRKRWWKEACAGHGIGQNGGDIVRR